MTIVTRRVKNSMGKFEERDFPIYERKEADDAGIPYKEDYRDARAGDWALSTDGYVLECYRYTEARKKKGGKVKKHLVTRFYSFAVGVQPITENRNTGRIEKRDYFVKPFLDEGVGYSYASPRKWSEQESRNTRAKTAMALYTQYHVEEKGKPTWEQLLQVGDLYRPGNRMSVIHFKRFLKTDEGQKLFMEELKKILEDKEISWESSIAKMDQTYQEALKLGNVAVMRGVYKDEMELLREAEGQHPNDTNEEFNFALLDEYSESVTTTMISNQVGEIIEVEIENATNK